MLSRSTGRVLRAQFSRPQFTCLRLVSHSVQSKPQTPAQAKPFLSDQVNDAVTVNELRSPLTLPLKRLKWLSLASCAASSIAAPMLLWWHGESALPFSARCLTAAVVLLTGFGSTGLLAAFTRVYVTQVTFTPPLTRLYRAAHPSDVASSLDSITGWHQVQVHYRTLDLWGRERTHCVPMTQLEALPEPRLLGNVRVVDASPEARQQRVLLVQPELFQGSPEAQWIWDWFCMPVHRKRSATDQGL